MHSFLKALCLIDFNERNIKCDIFNIVIICQILNYVTFALPLVTETSPNVRAVPHHYQALFSVTSVIVKKFFF